MNQHHTGKRGFTLVEVMIVTVIFSLMLGLGMKMLINATRMQDQQFASSSMQFTADQAFDDLSFYLEKSSLRYVDTRMRVKDGTDFEASDKFPVSYYPDMMQCPSETDPYAWNAKKGAADPETALFSSNYNYFTDSGPSNLRHNSAYFESDDPDRGTSHAGKIYNDYYNPDNPGQTVCKYDGTQLSRWITMDVLQFPVPYNAKNQFVIGEGKDERPDWQGYLIYAPYYNNGQKTLELRRYSIFVTDFFEEFFWRSDPNPVNPLYDVPGGDQKTLRPSVEDVANISANEFVGPVKSTAYLLTSYNQIDVNGTPPDVWGINPDKNDDKPTLHNLFDFDGDGQIETNQNSDIGEASREWFRLYPSRSLETASVSDDSTDNTQVLIFNKYEDDPDRLKWNFEEMELHYLIDLKTGWTRLYYYADWGSDEIEIDASFVRSKALAQPFPGWMNPDEQTAYRDSPLFTPYKELGSGFTGISFSTEATYPNSSVDPRGDAAGVSSSTDVKVGFSLDRQVLQGGRVEFANQTYQTSITPILNR